MSFWEWMVRPLSIKIVTYIWILIALGLLWLGRKRWRKL